MYAAQARRTPGVELAIVADLDPERAAAGCGPPAGRTLAADHRRRLRAARREARGGRRGHRQPVAGAPRTRGAAIDAGRHVVMVNVEADVLAGRGARRRARAAAGVVYSLAYGDQPALICELVDWARTAGFEVVAAGKGTKYQPAYHAVTPDGVWEHYGLSAEQVAAGGLNARCSPRSSTARSRRSRWRRSPTPPGSTSPPTGSRSRPPGRTSWPRCWPARRGRGRGGGEREPRRLAGGARPALGRLRRGRARPTTTSPRGSPTTGWRRTRRAGTRRSTARTT